MVNTVGVTIDNDSKIYYVDLKKLSVKKNVTVIIKTDKGVFFGKVVTSPLKLDSVNVWGEIERISTKKDFQEYKKNCKEEITALQTAKKLAAKYKLDINIIDAKFTFDRDQLIFHFYSDNRVDFRLLAKDLAAIYKTRIELRQIGVRDKAKKVGGYGCCGQKLCCARFLNDFDSVSISMAKNQNLSLNPNKINGICGRLLCCLKYENECYKNCKQKEDKNNPEEQNGSN